MWNDSSEPSIELDDFEGVLPLVEDDLDGGFFRARMDKTTDAEREYPKGNGQFGRPWSLQVRGRVKCAPVADLGEVTTCA